MLPGQEHCAASSCVCEGLLPYLLRRYRLRRLLLVDFGEVLFDLLAHILVGELAGVGADAHHSEGGGSDAPHTGLSRTVAFGDAFEEAGGEGISSTIGCLLYTSDAADDCCRV